MVGRSASMLALLAALCATVAGGVAQALPAPADIAALVDNEISATHKREGITPAKPASDAEFLRRAYLDVLGMPPTRDEATKFLEQKGANKRAKLIDLLLADTRFGKHLADLWTAILAGRSSERGGGLAGDLLAVWLAERFNRNARFDETITALVTATGKASENPAAVYIQMLGQPPRPADVAGQVMKHFAGVQIQCAQCHDHPYDKTWRQTDFAGIASFFSPLEPRIDFSRQPLDPELAERDLPGREALEAYKRTVADAEARARAEEMLTYFQPQLPGDRPVKTRAANLWRPMFARWLVTPENPTTARYLVNRFWSFLFGSGLVMPVDDFNALTKPAHPALLEALGRDFARDYDVKRLYRGLLNSRIYQLSSERTRQTEPGLFASARVRQLSPEQFFGALLTLAEGDAFVKSFGRLATSPLLRIRILADITLKQRKPGDTDPFNREALARYEKLVEPMDERWRVRRALAAMYSRMSSDDEMADADGFTLSIDQALSVLNGDVTRRLGGSLGGTLLHNIFEVHNDTAGCVGALYLSVLSRRPTEAEAGRAKAFIEGEERSGRAATEAWEDLFFALISTTEFSTNH